MKVLIILFALLFTGHVLAKPLNGIVVFGDSLSDNGNLYKAHGIPDEPYYQGRFSNGPVWAERLAASYFRNAISKRFLDKAYGGAGVSDDPDLYTLKFELDEYFKDHQVDKNSLYVVWIGANNYLDAPSNQEHSLQEVMQGISDGIHRLVEAGAKHVLLVNTPDLGRTPYALSTSDEAQQTLSSLSRAHNERLKGLVDGFKAKFPEVEWFYFDVGSHFDELLNNPDKYGFDDIANICYGLSDEPAPNKAIELASSISLDILNGKNCEGTDCQDKCGGHFFFDPLHPTAKAHQIIAEKAKTFLDAAGIEFLSD